MARRLDSLNRQGVRIIDPARTDRHIEKHAEKLGKLRKLVEGIVRRCLLEVKTVHGDERFADRSALVRKTYDRLLVKYRSVRKPVAVFTFGENEKNKK